MIVFGGGDVGEEVVDEAAEHWWYFALYKFFHDLQGFDGLFVGEACFGFELLDDVFHKKSKIKSEKEKSGVF